MNIWDWLIIISVVLQFVALAVLGVVALRFKQGTVTAVLARVKGLTTRGKKLAIIGKSRAELLRPHIEAMTAEVLAMKTDVEVTGTKFGALTEQPRSFATKMAKFQAGVSIVRQGLKMLPARSRRTTVASDLVMAVPQNQPPRSLADRLGLIPPIVYPVLKARPYFSTALSVYKELQNQGLVPPLRLKKR